MTLFDFCIIGAGPAGVTLASELISQKPKTKICLIDSGNLNKKNNFENKNLQDFTELNHVNKIINPVHKHRLFLFGGTTNHWGGWCRPLDPEDFKIRPGYSKNYWPIDQSELDKYLDKAKTYLDLKNTFTLKANEVCFTQDQKNTFDLEEINFDYSHPNIIYNKYKNLNKKIIIKLDCIAFRFSINEKKNFVEYLECINSTTKQKENIYARNFILSAGALETTRFLLNNNFNNKNFFNQSGVLGKGFNDHPHFYSADFVSFNNFHKKETIFLKNSFKFQIKNKILNSSIRLIKDNSKKSKLINEFKSLFLKNYKNTLYTGSIYCISEMEIRNSNRIELSKNRYDNFGIPQIDFYFSFSDMDLESIRLPVLNISKFLTNYNFARVKIKDWIIDKNIKPNFEESGWVGHHMGTTRMSETVNTGIVDKNLKLHNLTNGYVLSSSVFPTGGASNPTFTIVSLALRLADHLKKFV